jgi:hypothetical protein
MPIHAARRRGILIPVQAFLGLFLSPLELLARHRAQLDVHTTQQLVQRGAGRNRTGE